LLHDKRYMIKNCTYRVITLTIFLLSCFSLSKTFGQGTYMPLDPETYHMVDRLDIRYGKVLKMPHTSSKPYLRGEVAHAAEQLKLSNIKLNKKTSREVDYLMDDNAEWLDSLKSKNPRPLWLFRQGSKAALYREPATFAKVDVKNFNLRFNPIISFRAGGESRQGGVLMVNTRGLDMRFNIKNIVSAYFMFTENQMKAPQYVRSNYLRDSLDTREFNPGEMYWKEYNSKYFGVTDGVDFFQTRGYININALDYFNITFGHDKNFIGNGYRSMFLSDNSAPYLFLKLNTRIWKFNYQNIFCELVNQYQRGSDQLLPKKYGAFHHLDIDITKWLNIGLFEGTVMNRSNHFELQYLNPIIFYRAIEQSIGSPDNSLLGIDFKLNLFNHISTYGQFSLDEFNFKRLVGKDKWWANKYAFQVGMKYIDIIPNLDAQIEFNFARPFTFSHNATGNGTANYTHYNQPLVHPLGANFTEVVFIARYQPAKRFFMTFKYIYSTYGEDTIDHVNNRVTHYGGNIFTNTTPLTVNNSEGAFSEIGHKHLQGAVAKQHFVNLRISYMFWHNVYADMELLIRNKTSTYKAYSNATTYFAVGMRINIPYKENVF
jgi:hypothetical protein